MTNHRFIWVLHYAKFRSQRSKFSLSNGYLFLTRLEKELFAFFSFLLIYISPLFCHHCNVQFSSLKLSDLILFRLSLLLSLRLPMSWCHFPAFSLQLLIQTVHISWCLHDLRFSLLRKFASVSFCYRSYILAGALKTGKLPRCPSKLSVRFQK